MTVMSSTTSSSAITTVSRNAIVLCGERIAATVVAVAYAIPAVTTTAE